MPVRAGFAKGLPEEDNQAKRELSKLRADAVAKTLQKHGARSSRFRAGSRCPDAAKFGIAEGS